MPVSMQRYYIHDYWSGMPWLRDWAVRQTVFKLNIQIAMRVHFDVHGQELELDPDIMATFARLQF